MTLLLQVCPIQPHSCCYHCHFQGCPKNQALSPIAQGHILHHHNTIPSWNWCNTIFPLPKQQGHKTPSPNSPAHAKPLSLRWQNLPLRARLSTLDKGNSLAVLDQESGQLLKHRQLQRDSCYKEVWDPSYSNELGHLCQ